MNIVVPFEISTIDKTTECGYLSCFNFVEFISINLYLFKLKLYAIVAVPFGNEPTIQYLQHHRAARDGCLTDFLCDYYFDEFKMFTLTDCWQL